MSYMIQYSQDVFAILTKQHSLKLKKTHSNLRKTTCHKLCKGNDCEVIKIIKQMTQIKSISG